MMRWCFFEDGAVGNRMELGYYVYSRALGAVSGDLEGKDLISHYIFASSHGCTVLLILGFDRWRALLITL